MPYSAIVPTSSSSSCRWVSVSRRYSRILGYLLSTLVYALYCVWQFAYAYGQVDLRYLLLAVEYLPMGLALTWCYDNGGSIWSPIALHAVINAFALFFAVA